LNRNRDFCYKKSHFTAEKIRETVAQLLWTTDTKSNSAITDEDLIIFSYSSLLAGEQCLDHSTVALAVPISTNVSLTPWVSQSAMREQTWHYTIDHWPQLTRQ